MDTDMCTDCNIIRTIVLERDVQTKCWTARFFGFEDYPARKLPLPYTAQADLFMVAYALRARHGAVAIINQEPNGRRYAVSFVA